ncbi:unnamed protein product [Ambrosiozyma monospora]|uniref:Unnamed protein product n=1 Tax=Ambrosiozyma monospora TaxID=43982 RepID=A0ACB5TJ74_AMBMO|nr:unnamed protein product [Ambrosiozyma monospora]
MNQQNELENTASKQKGTRKRQNNHAESNSANNHKVSSSKAPKKIACTECRQQKAKCDAHDKAPGPCTRCMKRGIECRLNSDYKRTFKRAKIAQMEKEYEQMRMKLAYQNSPVVQSQNINPSNPPPISSTVIQRNNSPFLPPISALSPSATIPAQPVPVGSVQSIPPYFSPSPFPSSATRMIPSPPPHHPPMRHTPLKEEFYPIPSNGPPSSSANSQFSSSPQILKSPQLYQTALGKVSEDKSLFSNQYLGPSVVRVATGEQQTFFGKKIPEPRSVPKLNLEEGLAECSPKSLGEVTLSSDQIRVLFLDFVACYHPMLPIVDINKGIERLHRLCPILFWTIMFTALRRHKSATLSKFEAQKLYFSLTSSLKSALAELTISPITRYAPSELEEPILNVSSVYSVQALLIYTLWPPLTSSLSADNSWNSIGLALFQAIH